jgi:hypothetical protein
MGGARALAQNLVKALFDRLLISVNVFLHRLIRRTATHPFRNEVVEFVNVDKAETVELRSSDLRAHVPHQEGSLP